MRFSALFVVASIALSALAVPLPVADTAHNGDVDSLGPQGVHGSQHRDDTPFAGHPPEYPFLPPHAEGHNVRPHPDAPLLPGGPQRHLPPPPPPHAGDLARFRNTPPLPDHPPQRYPLRLTSRAPVKPAAAAGHTKPAATTAKLTVAPGVEEMKKHLKVAPNGVLFYAGPGGYQEKARKRASEMKLKILEDSWVDKKFPDPYMASLSAAEQKKFWDNASQALAELSSGIVHVLLPADTVGTKFFAGAIWARIEWPALQKNAHVTKVIKIYPENTKQDVIKG